MTEPIADAVQLLESAMTDAALVLFSGGQDSTTCLAWALERYDRVETIGFSYGQRHEIELACRDSIRAGLEALSPTWKSKLGRDHLIDLSVLGQVSVSALTADQPFGTRPDGLPATFVPGRNLVFLTFAAITAHQRNLKYIVTGVCETDYSGYPDCRDDTVKALQAAINLGMESRLVIETPLMWIDKAATWKLAQDLGGKGLVDLILERTHTCYQGDRKNRHEWGYGCGTCDACKLRGDGWRRYSASSGDERLPRGKLITPRTP
jgi:7-cyano-7-deazaguanine synthase